MNRSLLRYKLYKYSLEENLSQQQRDVILSEGFFSSMMGVLGVPGKAMKKFGNIVSDAFDEGEFESLSKSLNDNFDDLKNAAKKMKNGDKIVAGILNSLLNKAGFKPSDVATTDLSKIDTEDNSDNSGSQLNPGEPVKTSISDANSAPAADTPTGALVSAALANASGVDPQEAINQAKEKNVSFQKAYKNLVNKVSQESEEDVGVVKKVLDWLIDNEKIVPTTKVSFGESVRTRDDLIFERWGQLAGVIKEAPGAVDASTTGANTAGAAGGEAKAAAGGEAKAAAGEAAKKAKKAKKKKTDDSPTGDNAKLIAFVAKQTSISPNIVSPILDVLVKKCGVKLAK